MVKKSRKQRSVVKKTIHWLHLYLGLVTGLVVFVVSLTGCLFVFHEEINDLVNIKANYVKVPKDKHTYPVDTLLNKLAQTHPEIRLLTYTVRTDPSRSHQVMIMDPAKGNFLSLGNAYINPYTGDIIKVDYTYGVFRFIAAIHMNLLLGETGSWIVKVSTVIFLFGLLSGIVLWWPKNWNKTAYASSFKIKWSARWRRLSLDLHNVLGFYSLPVAIVVVCTGLLLAYPTLNNRILPMFGGKAILEKHGQVKPTEKPIKDNPLALDLILEGFKSAYPKVNLFTLSVPNKQGTTLTVSAAGNKSMVTHDGIRSTLDKYTGKPAVMDIREAANDAIRNTTLSLHIGTWSGLWYKCLTFLVSLVATSLPVTGLLIWLGKRKRLK